MTDDAPRVAEILGGDHREIDADWDRIVRSPSADAPSRRALLRSFAEELRFHIAVEEAELFPRMRERDPTQENLVRRLLEEHGQIREILGRVERELERPDPDLAALDEELRNVLGEHNAREERFAYPWFDRNLTPAEAFRVREEFHRPRR